MRNSGVLLDKQSDIDFRCATIVSCEIERTSRKRRAFSFLSAVFFFDFPCSRFETKRGKNLLFLPSECERLLINGLTLIKTGYIEYRENQRSSAPAPEKTRSSSTREISEREQFFQLPFPPSKIIKEKHVG